MKVTIKIPKKQKETVFIHTPYIRLDAALKLANVVGSGGMAKEIILAEAVKVNHIICTQRGKKLRNGDIFEFENRAYEIKDENNSDT